jgi:hypothetical protein
VEPTGSAGVPLYRRADALRYVVFFENGGSAYQISVELGPFFFFFRRAFPILFVYELLILFSRLPKDRRIVRRTMEPISELAEAAKSLNQAENQFDPDKMAAMPLSWRHQLFQLEHTHPGG